MTNWNKLEPTRGKIVVRRDRVGKTTDDDARQLESGLYIPVTVAKREESRNIYATVLAVGKPRITDAGTEVPIDLAPGDRVLITPYTGTEYSYEADGKVDEVEVISYEGVIARVREAE